MTEQDYHSDFEYISRSMLSAFCGRNGRSRFHRYYIERQERPFEENDNTRIGTGTHAITMNDVNEIDNCMLVPDRVLGKNSSRNTNAYKMFKYKNRGKTLLLESQYKLCQSISRKLHEKIGGLIIHEKALREQEYRWADENGLRFRMKADIEIPGTDDEPTICVDIKTAASLDQFRREIGRRRLWLQDRHYSAGLVDKYGCPVRFMFAVVEKHGDHDLAIIELDDEAKSLAQESYDELRAELASCYESGDWQDPNADQIERISLSAREVKWQ